jgi:hypothetical protein
MANSVSCKDDKNGLNMKKTGKKNLTSVKDVPMVSIIFIITIIVVSKKKKKSELLLY